TSQLQLLVGDVDRDDASALDVRVLDGKVSQTADAEDRDEIRGVRAAELDRLVRRDSRTRQRRRVERVNSVGDLDHIPRVSGGVFTESAIDAIAGVLLVQAQRLPTRNAVVTRATGVTEPRQRNAFAYGDLADPRT